jgi:hypothetical protein
MEGMCDVLKIFLGFGAKGSTENGRVLLLSCNEVSLRVSEELLNTTISNSSIITHHNYPFTLPKMLSVNPWQLLNVVA